jgi:hypothetical protein
MQYFGESDYSRAEHASTKNPLKLSELEFKPRDVLLYFNGDEDVAHKIHSYHNNYDDSSVYVCAKNLRDFARIENIYNKINRKHRKTDKSFWELLKTLRLQAKNEYPTAHELFLLSKKHSNFYYTVDLRRDSVTYGIDSSRNLRECIATQSFLYDFCSYANDDVENCFEKEILSRKLSVRKMKFFEILEASLLCRILHWYEEIFLKDKNYYFTYNNVNGSINISININGRDYYISKSHDSRFKLFAGKNHLVFEQ